MLIVAIVARWLDAHVDLIIELAGGGELFDLIIAKGHFSERDAAHVIRQMCEAIGYLHERGIAHR